MLIVKLYKLKTIFVIHQNEFFAKFSKHWNIDLFLIWFIFTFLNWHKQSLVREMQDQNNIKHERTVLYTLLPWWITTKSSHYSQWQACIKPMLSICVLTSVVGSRVHGVTLRTLLKKCMKINVWRVAISFWSLLGQTTRQQYTTSSVD